jgi:NADH-quinone oxidoreductase subunit C
VSTTPPTAPTTPPTSPPPATDEVVAPTPQAAAVAAVRAAFGGALVDVVEFRGETTLVVQKEPLVALLRLLRDDPALQFDRLADVTAVDYLDLGREPRFAAVYHLMSRRTYARLRVRAQVPEDDPVIDSVTDLYPSANWLEREVYDMMGIQFAGHPDPTRILMPDDWEGHPLRKDFPYGAEEIDFSFNHEVIDAERPQTLTEREERYRTNRPVNNY